MDRPLPRVSSEEWDAFLHRYPPTDSWLEGQLAPFSEQPLRIEMDSQAVAHFVPLADVTNFHQAVQAREKAQIRELPKREINAGRGKKKDARKPRPKTLPAPQPLSAFESRLRITSPLEHKAAMRADQPAKPPVVAFTSTATADEGGRVRLHGRTRPAHLAPSDNHFKQSGCKNRRLVIHDDKSNREFVSRVNGQYHERLRAAAIHAAQNDGVKFEKWPRRYGSCEDGNFDNSSIRIDENGRVHYAKGR